MSGAVSQAATTHTMVDTSWVAEGALLSTYNGDPDVTFQFQASAEGHFFDGTTTIFYPRGLYYTYPPVSFAGAVIQIGANYNGDVRANRPPSTVSTITYSLVFSKPVVDLSFRFIGIDDQVGIHRPTAGVSGCPTSP